MTLPAHPDTRRQRCTPKEIDDAIQALTDSAGTIPADTWPGTLCDLDASGLYRWSVDSAGAADLSIGLDEIVSPGLIYAGLTGATKWPSGKTGTMTLRQRIGSNHLRGTIRSSTFRRTLAATLAIPLGLGTAASGRLTRHAEQTLTGWMRQHLAVAVHPFGHRDALADLEREVLRILDPPLNLDGRPPNRTRLRLAALRAGLVMPQAPADGTPATVLPITHADARSVTLHQEIADILAASPTPWMTTAVIAEQVNKRGRYRKRDGTPVTAFQIHGRTRNYPTWFRRDGSRVALAQ